MNMLIIGNGFDLAHGRPTTYADFLQFLESILWVRNDNRNRTVLEEHIEADISTEYTNPFLVMHPLVKKYILSTIDTRYNSDDGSAHNKNKTIQELYDCLEENIWYEYFQIIVQKGKIRGKNWIDFESEIQEIIKFFDEKFYDLYEPYIIKVQEKNSLSSKIRMFYSKLDFSKFNAAKGRTENYIPNCLDFIEKTYQDLEKLIRCLEIYLGDCVAKIPITCCSPDIKGLECDSVLSFNYTEIPTKIYPSLTNTHYIHGFAEIKRPAEENNMVLGVNEYWEGSEKNFRTNFNLYKKFVQRIIKETGINYKSTLLEMQSEFENSRKNQTFAYTGPQYSHVYIFGHSLDVTDGDILREVIRNPGVITTIFYKDKQQQANQIANLSKVLGQDELLKRTFSTFPSIIFQQQAGMVPV